MYNFLEFGFALLFLVIPEMAVIVPLFDICYVYYSRTGKGLKECSHFGREAHCLLFCWLKLFVLQKCIYHITNMALDCDLQL